MANITYRVNSNPAIPGTSIVKGTPLTNVEVDANFRAIDIEVDQLNSSTVRLTGNQTIDGVKTFSSPIAGAIRQLVFNDNRNVTEQPGQVPVQTVTAEFKENAAVGNPPVRAHSLYSHIINVAGWTADGSGGWPTQISVGGGGLAVRQGVNATTWGSWREMLHRGNGVALSGDQTIDGVKTFSSPPVVPDDAFTFAKLQNIATATILGRSTAGTGDVEALTAIPAGVDVPAARLSGDVAAARIANALNATVLGMGQTWQDVTASRALGTTYTNTTGRPILVCPWVGNNTGVFSNIVINGVSIRFAGESGSGEQTTGSFIVPPNATYSVDTATFLNGWWELR